MNDTVISHTSPSFCELQNKKELYRLACNDAQLLADVQQEWETIDCIHHRIKDCQTVTHGAMDTFIRVGIATLMESICQVPIENKASAKHSRKLLNIQAI